jgi:two-component system sensor histidine kinase YesM
MIFAEEKGRTASEASAAAAPAPQASGVHEKRRSLKGKLSLIVALSIIPLVAMVLYLIISLVSYSNAYEEIVSNMTIANSYSLSFKEDMDESVYKLVVSGKSFDEVKDNPDENPYALIDDLRNDFTRLEVIKTDDKSRDWLSYLLRNIDTLEDRVDDIKANIDDGEGHYNENIDMVNNDIYILTELIQDNIQHYIY